MAIVKSAAGSDCRKITSPRGSQARGEMGRSTWITGSKARLKEAESPNTNPRGIPRAIAILKPFATRKRLRAAKRAIPWFISPSLKNGRRM
jgi:hypothetical protein